MSDDMEITERLNTFRAAWFLPNHEGHGLLIEAVREIERLQNRVAELQGLVKTQSTVLDMMERQRQSRLPVVER